MLSNFTTVDKKIQITNSAVTLNQGNILSVSQNFTSSLSEMNNTVQDQLDIISKMPGPQVTSSIISISCFWLHFMIYLYTVKFCKLTIYGNVISLSNSSAAWEKNDVWENFVPEHQFQSFTPTNDNYWTTASWLWKGTNNHSFFQYFKKILLPFIYFP